MALAPTHYSLANAMERAWKTLPEDDHYFALLDLMPEKRPPSGEADLAKLQTALTAIDLLKSSGESSSFLLSTNGRLFPHAVRRFLSKTALHLQDSDHSLPPLFVSRLARFLNTNEAHLFTLNYDKLLYKHLVEEEILLGYNGRLVDGFCYKTGFKESNLEPKFGKTLRYYFHMHGSPLYTTTSEDMIKKLSIRDIDVSTYDQESHIVLTHFDHKRSVINQSDVLRVYWQYTEKILSCKTKRIIVLGYSGMDTHLNELIKASSTLEIEVVEWSGAGDVPEREAFWNKALISERLRGPECFKYTPLDSILDYDFC